MNYIDTLLGHEHNGRPIVMADYRFRAFWTVTPEDQAKVMRKELDRFESAPSWTKHPFSELPPDLYATFTSPEQGCAS